MTLRIVNFAFLAALLEVKVFAARDDLTTSPDFNSCGFRKT